MGNRFSIVWKQLREVDSVYHKNIQHFPRDPLDSLAATIGDRIIGVIWFNTKGENYYAQAMFNNEQPRRIMPYDRTQIDGPFADQETAKAWVDTGWTKCLVDYGNRTIPA